MGIPVVIVQDQVIKGKVDMKDSARADAYSACIN